MIGEKGLCEASSFHDSAISSFTEASCQLSVSIDGQTHDISNLASASSHSNITWDSIHSLGFFDEDDTEECELIDHTVDSFFQFPVSHADEQSIGTNDLRTFRQHRQSRSVASAPRRSLRKASETALKLYPSLSDEQLEIPELQAASYAPYLIPLSGEGGEGGVSKGTSSSDDNIDPRPNSRQGGSGRRLLETRSGDDGNNYEYEYYNEDPVEGSHRTSRSCDDVRSYEYNEIDGQDYSCDASYDQDQFQAEQHNVEVMPGVFEVLRGSDETIQAANRGDYVHATCLCCGEHFQRLPDCKYVLCPLCQSVNPASGQPEAFGVGLGFRLEDVCV